jgi:predicted ArsR family transcriptional regulator
LGRSKKLHFAIKPLPRDDIGKKLHLPRTTLYEALIRMQDENLIRVEVEHTGKTGQPKKYWMLMKHD